MLTFSEHLNVVYINMVTTFMMSAKLSTLGPLKIKVFLNKVYNVIIFVLDVTKNFLSSDSNHFLDAVMWSKFGKNLTSKNNFLRGAFGFSSTIWD